MTQQKKDARQIDFLEYTGSDVPPHRDMDHAFHPKCTVVICTRCRAAHLGRCLDAVAALVYPNFEVLVVDNTSGDPETQKIAARWNVRCLVEPRGGLSRARNYGARMTDAEIIAYIDDDALPEVRWLNALVEEFRDPLVMAVAGRTRTLAPAPETEPPGLPPESEESPVRQRMVVDNQMPGWFQLANFGGIGDGMNMAFRRQAFAIWPGFDERLGRGAILGGCEEHHAFFSLIDQGYRVVYTPGAVVSHPFARTRSEYRRHQIKDAIAVTAYTTLLLVEQPRYRPALLKLARQKVGCNRLFSGRPAPTPKMISRWALPFLWLWGPMLYVRSLIRNGRS